MGNDAFGASWGIVDWTGSGRCWGVCLEGALVEARAAVGWSRAGTSGTGDAVISKLGEVVCFVALLEWILRCGCAPGNGGGGGEGGA